MRQTADERAYRSALRRGVSYEMIAVLVGNYREDDDDLLIAALKKLGEKQHDVYAILARVTGGKGVDRLSTKMLAYLYETIRWSWSWRKEFFNSALKLQTRTILCSPSPLVFTLPPRLLAFPI